MAKFLDSKITVELNIQELNLILELLNKEYDPYNTIYCKLYSTLSGK